MIDLIRDLTEEALAAPDPAMATHAFHSALGRHGVTYLQSRAYRRPIGRLTARSHWDAGGFVARHVRPGWIGSAAHDYICFEQNPLLDAIGNGMTRYRFSDFAPHGARHFRPYWQAMAEGNMAEALCATAYGKDGAIASVHIGFDRREFAPGEAGAIQTAGQLLVETFIERMARMPAEHPARNLPELTRREQDAMAFVAEGKTDWEIATILGVSEATARFHVDNARRKLGAVNRPHAVSRYLVHRWRARPSSASRRP